MKDSYMIFVLLAILVTPLLPALLKGKCPNCGKRKLETAEGAADKGQSPYISYFSCSACHSKFMRDKSGPLQPLHDDASVETANQI